MNGYLCIHGHFYQPPRENPWLEAIELQDSAHPYHDWNERITAECYAPNAVSRILDGNSDIVKLVNNYAKISFDFAPTLLAWLETKAPDLYAAILAADQESRKQFSGHGSALAQVYNHAIMPLANRRDRVTQVRWGVRDFERRFKRAPEGMWLPETAVNLETLDVLAAHGIRFTILAPHQAARWRPNEAPLWTEATAVAIDTNRVYRQNLPSGRSIAIFFYNASIARGVAFEGLLSNGEQFVERLMGGFSSDCDWPQLVHIATNGEIYGHHHKFGDMALAFALDQIEAKQLAHLTNYGEFLARHPPTHEVEIVENSSWSCGHGIERWRGDCGCNTGSHPQWNQAWRGPLRQAFDWLRDKVAGPWEKHAREFFCDPWAARDAYVEVIRDRSLNNRHEFLARHGQHRLTEKEQSAALKLLELQRHLMLMYASCGWYFDELSGVETVQVLLFAARVVQLGQELFGASLESALVDRLAAAPSNLETHDNGRDIYEKLVSPARVDWQRVGAHYAVSLVFDYGSDEASFYCYRARRKKFQTFEAGRAKLALGEVELTSIITAESAELSFGVLHMGDHLVNGGVRPVLGEEVEPYLARELVEPFSRADFGEVIRLMDRRYDASNYSLRALFRDEQRRLSERILEAAMRDSESLYLQIYEHRAPMMRFLTALNIPVPQALLLAAEFVLNNYLRAALARPTFDADRVKMLCESAKVEGVALDATTLEITYRRTLEDLASIFVEQPTLQTLRALNLALTVREVLPFSVNLWKIQNDFHKVLQSGYPTRQRAGKSGDKSSAEWIIDFAELARKLRIRIPAPTD